MKLNVYEYSIKDKDLGEYVGSYTVIAGSANEAKLKKELHSHLVDSFESTYRPVEQVEKIRMKMILG